MTKGACVNCGFPVGFSDGATVGIPCTDHRAEPSSAHVEAPRERLDRYAHLGLPLNRSLYRREKSEDRERPSNPHAEAEKYRDALETVATHLREDGDDGEWSDLLWFVESVLGEHRPKTIKPEWHVDCGPIRGGFFPPCRCGKVQFGHFCQP